MNAMRKISFMPGALDHVMPMHLLLDSTGLVLHAGPTITKVLGASLQENASIFSLLEMRRPRRLHSFEQLRDLVGTKLYLRMRDEWALPLIATVTVLEGDEKVLLNLSFGYKIVEAVAHYGLTGSDFAPTDLTVEMLYLVEAKSAAMAASNKVAHRLHGEKTEAMVKAQTDGLTGLNNRRALDSELERLVAQPAQFAVMNIDLDFFKAVNDSKGHAAGDAVLVKVAEVLQEETREGDFAARVGGDEFVVILQRLTDKARLSTIAKRIIKKLEVPVLYKEELCQISASIGIATSSFYAPDALLISQIMEDADQALYASKAKGRACHTIFGEDAGAPDPSSAVDSSPVKQ